MAAKDDSNKIRNVGPKSAAWLRQVGVRTQEDLQRLGPVEAFMKVKRAGFRPSLNLLYALEGAILDCHWQDIPEARRAEIIADAEAQVALLPQPKGRRVPVAGPVTTTQHEPEARADIEPPEPELLGFDDPAAADE